MSQFIVATTKVSDPQVIVDAFKEMGVSEEHIEIHDIPAEMVGYDSNDVRVAEIIVRREHIGAYYGDIGATRYNAEGKKEEYFRFITDDMDCGKQDSEGTCHGRVDRRLGTTRGGFANHIAGRANCIAGERWAKRRGYRRAERVYNRDEAGNITGARLELHR